MQRQANEVSHLGPRQVGSFSSKAEDTAEVFANLHRFGIGFDARHIEKMFQEYRTGGAPMLNAGAGMDAALTPALTELSVTTPIQFLQYWLPGFVFIVTQARVIDELIGITTQGRWEDEEIVQGLLERTGNTAVYQDTTNSPQSSWNTNFETRTVIRFEEGLFVGRLEEVRASAMRVSSAESKRSAAAESLEITRNFTGFFGFNDGNNRTFGILNDPNLPAVVPVPDGGAVSPLWSTKTFLEITGDIRSWYQGLRDSAAGRIDPGKDPVTLALPLSVYDSLGVTSDFGNSVMQWLKETYPNTRVMSVPEFVGAGASSENLAYLYAEGVVDESTDDRRTWLQLVPSRFQSLGVQQEVKLYREGYSNATAGVMLKRPYAVFIASEM